MKSETTDPRWPACQGLQVRESERSMRPHTFHMLSGAMCAFVAGVEIDPIDATEIKRQAPILKMQLTQTNLRRGT